MKIRALSPILAVLGFIGFGVGLKDLNYGLMALSLGFFGIGIYIDFKTRPKK